MTALIFDRKKFIKIMLLTSIWVNASEVFRYFVLVRPEVKGYWHGIDKVADMNWLIFSIWGLWDTLLTTLVVFMFWIYAKSFGNNIKSVMTAATISWAFIFVVFWMAAANMGYSNWQILWITLPLSWFEMLIATYIASRLYKETL